MNAMYEYVLAKRKAMEIQARALEAGLNIKPKYEYDSDEETEGGTWEHKRRNLEMEATRGSSFLYYLLQSFSGLILRNSLLHRLGREADRDGERKAPSWGFPATRGVGKVHGNLLC